MTEPSTAVLTDEQRSLLSRLAVAYGMSDADDVNTTFEELVAYVESLRAAEREEAAKLCEDPRRTAPSERAIGRSFAAAIRARKA